MGTNAAVFSYFVSIWSNPKIVYFDRLSDWKRETSIENSLRNTRLFKILLLLNLVAFVLLFQKPITVAHRSQPMKITRGS